MYHLFQYDLPPSPEGELLLFVFILHYKKALNNLLNFFLPTQLTIFNYRSL